jgi:hypothetical protein
MGNYGEQDFNRLIKDKDFAFEVLLYNSHDLLRSAFNLYSKEPSKMNDIIYSIDISVDNHLSTKNKLKVIHDLLLELEHFSVVGTKNLYLIGSTKIIDFKRELSNTLQLILEREEGKILGTEDIFKMLHPKKDSIDYSKETGFSCNLTDEQLTIHHKELLGKYIDKYTSQKNYIAVFRRSFLPVKFIPIKWILLNDKKRPNKTALREFLTLALGKSPYQKTISICFTDQKGHEILLAKPKAGEFSNHYSFFEELIRH